MFILIHTRAALLFTLAPVSPVAARKASPDHFVVVAYGDTRSDLVEHRAVVAEIVRMRPEFVVQTGDLGAQGSNPAQWAQFDSIVSPLRAARIAYYPAEGNHDAASYLHPDNPLFRRELRAPSSAATTTCTTAPCATASPTSSPAARRFTTRRTPGSPSQRMCTSRRTTWSA